MRVAPPVPQPELTQPDGSALPRQWRILRWMLTRVPIPGRWHLVNASRRLWWGRLPAMTARWSDGRSFAIQPGDVMYSRIYREGEYAPAETWALRAVLRAGDQVVDIGANHGWFSLVMGCAVGTSGRVAAIEPVAAAFAALEKALEASAPLPIKAVRAACGSQEGAVRMHIFEGLPHTHASASNLGRADSTVEMCVQRTLDSLLVEVGMSKPTLVKVDVEGSEMEVLRGAGSLLSRSPPIWTIEVNYETAMAFGYDPADLLAEVRENGAIDTVLRITERRVQRETQPRSAPRGAIWMCIPATLKYRLPNELR